LQLALGQVVIPGSCRYAEWCVLFLQTYQKQNSKGQVSLTAPPSLTQGK